MRLKLILTNDVVAERIDIAIRIGELAASSLIPRRLVSNRRVICASLAYLEQCGTPTTPDDLAQHNCLILSAYKITLNQWRFKDGTGYRELIVQSNFQVNSGNALYDALLAGVGISRVATALATRDLQAGQLIRLLENYEDDTNGDICAVFPSDRYLLPKVRVFVAFLVNSFA